MKCPKCHYCSCCGRTVPHTDAPTVSLPSIWPDIKKTITPFMQYKEGGTITASSDAPKWVEEVLDSINDRLDHLEEGDL